MLFLLKYDQFRDAMYLLVYMPANTGLSQSSDRKVFPNGKARIRHVCKYYCCLTPFLCYGKGVFVFPAKGGEIKWIKESVLLVS